MNAPANFWKNCLGRCSWRTGLSLLAAVGLLATSGCNPPPPPKKKAAPPKKVVQHDPVAAVMSGDAETLRQALVADPELPTKRFNGNRTLLHILAGTPHTNCVKLLLLAGAKINETDAAGMTPLISAILQAQPTMAGYLIDNGADPNITSPKGRNAFHTAVVAGTDTAMLRALLKRGINIDATDNAGMTALHMASQQGDDVIVRFLLENGADMNRRTPEGLTALEIAKQIGRIQVVAALNAKQQELEPVRPVIEPLPQPTNVVAMVKPPPPPPDTKVRPGQVMLVIMNFGGNRVPGQRDVLVRNTGNTPAKGELIWKTINSTDQILSGSFNLNLAPQGQTQVRIGQPIPVVTNITRNVVGTTSYGYPRTTSQIHVTQPNETKFGFLVEFRVDGEVINIQAQPPDAKQRIGMFQGN